ncbi:MAG: GspH/FimT family pseudopilin [Burkholderiales bacterium]|nr:GspH/FimT family pseudopilin [Burkholderiales bacterium]MDE1926662.1 GspH/FimT family pseudopilin [Burkholderiales bacterium]MDE2158697.1 GspH/FimT family pseudopilin [Burkholderiales bacterium]MDE2503957.1 GspH/FimT family pseudopilin [Burkholderiales bacterium]
MTIIEMLIVVVVSALLLTLAVPAMTNLIAMQRLKSANAELVTGMQYARTEAVAHQPVGTRIKFQSNAQLSCYVVYIGSLFSNCNCTNSPGPSCPPAVNTFELNTTQVAKNTDIEFVAPKPDFVFGSDGELRTPGPISIDTKRVSGQPGTLRTIICAMGRPRVCSPDQSVPGFPACPVNACVTP